MIHIRYHILLKDSNDKFYLHAYCIKYKLNLTLCIHLSKILCFTYIIFVWQNSYKKISVYSILSIAFISMLIVSTLAQDTNKRNSLLSKQVGNRKNIFQKSTTTTTTEAAIHEACMKLLFN